MDRKVEPADYGRQRTPKIHIARKGKEDKNTGRFSLLKVKVLIILLGKKWRRRVLMTFLVGK